MISNNARNVSKIHKRGLLVANLKIKYNYTVSFYIIYLILISGVPLHLFFVSVFFGLMPYNYMCVTSGAILSELNDISEIMSWTNFGKISITVCFFLLYIN